MLKPRLDPSIGRQIQNLIKKSHTPRVKVSTSNIRGAGNGVHSQISVELDSMPHVMCLYPGIYTPPMPSHNNACVDGVSLSHYLANQLPPSAISYQENAYIMNLQSRGGYIDGCALMEQHGSRLDENPSACGHLINHNASKDNVEVVSFFWKDVCDISKGGDNRFPFPNNVRADGSPWYFDGFDQRVVEFPEASDPSKPSSLACGAAIILRKPIRSGEELLLDYGLHLPYPDWASGWY